MGSSGYRSRTSTRERNMPGRARSGERRDGRRRLREVDRRVANSFTQFVSGHVYLHDVGQRVKAIVDAAGGRGVEFNIIAVDDGIPRA